MIGQQKFKFVRNYHAKIAALRVLTYFKPDRNEGASNDCFSGVNEFLVLYNIFKTEKAN
jgi:hypothetical protein